MNNKYESLEETVLHRKSKNLKKAIQVFTVTIIIYGIVMFYLMLTGQWEANNNPLIVIPMFFMVVFIFLNNARTALGKEIARRNENQGA